MEKCSMSPMLLCVSMDVLDVAGRRGHRPSLSVGEGCSSPEVSQLPGIGGLRPDEGRVRLQTYGKVDTAVIDNY